MKIQYKGNNLVRLLSALFLALILLATPRSAEARYSHIVFDAYSGKVLYQQDQHAARQPASLTKMMTAYLAFEAIKTQQVKWNTRLRVSKKASRQSPSKLGLNPGDTISVHDAVLALITRSANDVAVVLAEGLAGNEAKFAQAMTAKARQLGMSRTTFRNASGLPARGQTTTARDMGVLGQALIRDHPEYYKMFNTESFVFRGQEIRNHNHLLGNYPGLDGIKTGYIRASGFNLVASAERGGRRLVGVVMGGRSTGWRDLQMQKLLDQGFESVGVGKAYAAYPVSPNKVYSEEDIPDSVAGQDFSAQPESDSTPAPQVAAAAAPEPTPVSNATSEPVQESWGLQVGAYRSLNQARKAVAMARRLANPLSEAEPKVLETARGRKRLYRARLYGLSEESAQAGCTELKKHKLNCTIISPTSKTS